MATVDASAQQAYADIRSDANPATWVYLPYADANTVTAGASGNGGFDELAAHFKDNEVAYGYYRTTTGDNESKRAKFVFVAWAPDAAPVMRKAKLSVHKANVKEVFREFAIELLASDRVDLDPERVQAAVVKAGGANYEGQKH